MIISVDCFTLCLQLVSEDSQYDVKMCVEEAAVIIMSESEPKTTCAVTLTSPVMRDDNPNDAGIAGRRCDVVGGSCDVMFVVS